MEYNWGKCTYNPQSQIKNSMTLCHTHYINLHTQCMANINKDIQTLAYVSEQSSLVHCSQSLIMQQNYTWRDNDFEDDLHLDSVL